MADASYSADGWNVKHRGAPYDLELTRAGEKRTVEVKGTTSIGEAVPLTAGEVSHHAKAHPNNALVIVRGNLLTARPSPLQSAVASSSSSNPSKSRTRRSP